MEVDLTIAKKRCENIIQSPEKQKLFDEWFNDNYFDVKEDPESYLAEGMVSFWENFINNDQ